MKRALLTTALILGVAMPAFADVTLKQTTTGKGLGISGTMAGTTYIKGNKMRTDVVMGDKTQTTIFDMDQGSISNQTTVLWVITDASGNNADCATYGHMPEYFEEQCRNNWND
jgi:hypothetical protein